MNPLEIALAPVLTTFILGVFVALVRWGVNSVTTRIDHLDTGMARIAGQLADEQQNFNQKLDQVDKRVTRIESWKELVTLPSAQKDLT